MAAAELQAAEIRRRTILAGLLALGTRTTQSALLLTSGIVLARLLTPEEFGVFAMALPLWLLGSELGNRNFQTTLLQRRALAPGDVHGLFRFALIVNVLVAGGMVAAGIALARVYREPRVLAVVLVWAGMPALLTPTMFREALLKRDLRFPAVLLVRITSLAMAVAVSIAAAWHGAGYWALPIQVIATEVGRVIGMRALSDWRPRRARTAHGGAVAAMRRSWTALVGLSLASWVNGQPDLLVVGRLGGAPVLGLYDAARRWSWYPFVEPFFALSEVAVASFSRVQADPARFRDFVTRGVLVMLTVSMPAIAFVGVETPSVIRVLLGDQWSAAVPYMRWLSVAAFAGSLARVTQWVYVSLGRVRRLFVWSACVQGPLTVGAALVGLAWGPLAVAAALAAGAVLVAVPAVRFGVHGTPLTPTDVLRAAARPAVASMAAAMMVLAFQGALPEDPGARRLAAGLAIYVATLAAAWFGMPGGIGATRALVGVLREFR